MSAESRAGGTQRTLRELISVLREECSSADLPPIFLRTDQVAKGGRVARTPGRDALISALRAEGARLLKRAHHLSVPCSIRCPRSDVRRSIQPTTPPPASSAADTAAHLCPQRAVPVRRRQPLACVLAPGKEQPSIPPPGRC